MIAGGGQSAQAGVIWPPHSRLLLLALFAALLVLRLPQAWLHGRFQNEEAAVFLAYAWHHPAGEALGRVFGGYLNLAANGITLVVAQLVRGGTLPLELAPRLTMLAGTAFQLIPAALLLWGRGRWLDSRWAVICGLLLLALAPMTEEVFANLLHIQYHLALAAGLILACDVPTGRVGQVACGLILLLGPLCGPGAIILLPLFALRTLLDRDPGRLIQALALAAGAAVQLLLFYSPSPLRGHLLDPATLAGVLFVRTVALPYLSAPVAEALGRQFHAAWQSGAVAWWLIAFVAIAWFATLALAAVRRLDAALWLVFAGLAIGSVTFGAGMLPVQTAQWFSPTSSERYNYLPMALLGLGMIALAQRQQGAYSALARRLAMLAPLAGALTFALPLAELASGPDWRAEVARWRADHDYHPQTWPAKWRADLSDETRPCSPPGVIAPDDPEYCDGYWQALVKRDAGAQRSPR